MKLTTEQIAKIDDILGNQGLDFLDFKLEIKDHVATQIEDLCKNQNIGFEEALPIVLKEWESSLVLKESIWISNKRRFSVVVLNSIMKRYIYYNSFFIFVFIGLSIFYFFNVEDFETTNIKNIMVVTSTVLFLFLSSLQYFISLNKQETSYSYEFSRIYKMATIFWFFDVASYFVRGIYPNILWKAMVVAYFPIAIYSYIKHIQFKKRLNIV
jgi:hypothetical protein